MKTYVVSIEEKVVKQFEIVADNEAVALQQAIANYKTGKFVLDPGEVQEKKISVLSQDGDFKNWTEF